MGMGAHARLCPICKDLIEPGQTHVCATRTDGEQQLHAEVEKAFVASLSSDEVMRALLSRAYHVATKKIQELTPKKKDNNVRIRLENTLHRLYTQWSKQVGYPERQ